MENNFDVIIIGAGAAGLFCAIEAGKRGRKVLVIEHEDKPGKKILISGGGRCNFTNKNAAPENFISHNPHFARSALTRYTAQDFISLVDKHNIKWYEKKAGQLFCSNSAKDILNMLLKECRDAGVTIELNCVIHDIVKNHSFHIFTNTEDYTCESLVVASGGISIPKMGATDIGYKIAQNFSLNILQPEPGLVPLIMDKDFVKTFGSLSGVSVYTLVSCNGTSFRENILFTHKGLSGPAILQISNYMNAGDSITIDLLPDIDIENEITGYNPGKAVNNFLAKYLPERLADIWCEKYFQTKPVKQLTGKEIMELSELLHNWELKPAGTEGFGKAEVTKGGVDTAELSSKTMEVKKVKGLYFIGEVTDVTGWLGGYNFQWAWSSGWACGQVC